MVAQVTSEGVAGVPRRKGARPLDWVGVFCYSLELLLSAGEATSLPVIEEPDLARLDGRATIGASIPLTSF
jgi:hypothetical protein